MGIAVYICKSLTGLSRRESKVKKILRVFWLANLDNWSGPMRLCFKIKGE